jgi:hypothetical protein
VFGNVASKSCICVEIEAHGQLAFWDQGNEFRELRQLFFHPDGSSAHRNAIRAVILG